MNWLPKEGIDVREPRTSHALVVDMLGREIVSGKLQSGSILPGDKELGERFDVSRTVLRESMKTLAAKSLVEPKARVGTRILDRSRWNLLDPDVLRWRVEAGLDETFIADLATMRLAFEPAAAALAAERATPEDFLRLHAIVDRMGDPGHDRASIARADLAFHVAIAEISRNPFMRAVGSLIETALAIAFRLSSPANDPAQIAEVALNHRLIVEAMARGNEEETRARMRKVIEIGAERTRRALGSEPVG